MTRVTLRFLEQAGLILFSLANLPTGAFAQSGIIDTPTKMMVLTGTSAYASGWALGFTTPITSVRFNVDGIDLGNASYGIYRPDVCQVLGNYPGCPYLGWSIYFNTTQFPDGA